MENSNQSPLSIQLADIVTQLFIHCHKKEARFVHIYNVTPIEFRTLRFLNNSRKLTVGELAHDMDLTTSRITRIIDSLEEKGYVIREPGKNDRRIYNLSLTATGKRQIKKMLYDYLSLHEDILKTIKPEDQKVMLRYLLKLKNALEEWLYDKDDEE